MGKIKNKRSKKTNNSAYVVGRSYFLRTVTHYYTGKLLAVYDDALLLGDAAWIADTGRFGEALKTGRLVEVEPYPDRLIVARGAIVDACLWDHPLPREVK